MTIRSVLIGTQHIEVNMNYVVTARIEIPATSEAEAEDIVMGMELVDLEGKSLDDVYIEIEGVSSIG